MVGIKAQLAVKSSCSIVTWNCHSLYPFSRSESSIILSWKSHFLVTKAPSTSPSTPNPREKIREQLHMVLKLHKSNNNIKLNVLNCTKEITYFFHVVLNEKKSYQINQRDQIPVDYRSCDKEETCEVNNLLLMKRTESRSNYGKSSSLMKLRNKFKYRYVMCF